MWALWILGVTVLAGVAWLALAMQGDVSVATIVTHERRLRELIAAAPWRAFAVGFVIYTALSLVPGTTGKSMVVGWLFGFWPALLMVVGALTVAGVSGFLMARGLWRGALQRYLGLRLTRFDRLVEQEGAFYLLTLRLLHAPFTLVNYLSGVSRVHLRTFIWTTAVGLVPATAVLVGLGARLPSLAELAQEGLMGLVDPGVGGALVAMAAVPWSVRRLYRYARRVPDRQTTNGDPAHSEEPSE